MLTVAIRSPVSATVFFDSLFSENTNIWIAFQIGLIGPPQKNWNLNKTKKKENSTQYKQYPDNDSTNVCSESSAKKPHSHNVY